MVEIELSLDLYLLFPMTHDFANKFCAICIDCEKLCNGVMLLLTDFWVNGYGVFWGLGWGKEIYGFGDF